MSETPQSKSFTDNEIAEAWRDLDDRLLAIENGGGDQNTMEAMRLVRLMRVERHAYETFANNFSAQAETLLKQIDEKLAPAIEAIEEQGSATLSSINKSKKQVDGKFELMRTVLEDLQVLQATIEEKAAELGVSQADLKTMQNTVMTRWNEQTQEIKTANIEQYAAKAAANTVAELTDKRIDERILAMRNKTA